MAPKAILPNNEVIQATIKGNLNLHLALKHRVLVFPTLQSESLLSIGQFCDDGCIALFEDKVLKTYKSNTEIRKFLNETKQHNLVLEGQRNSQDRLYDVSFPQLKLSYII